MYSRYLFTLKRVLILKKNLFLIIYGIIVTKL